MISPSDRQELSRSTLPAGLTKNPEETGGSIPCAVWGVQSIPEPILNQYSRKAIHHQFPLNPRISFYICGTPASTGRIIFVHQVKDLLRKSQLIGNAMGIITRDEILKELEAGNIVIDPFDESCVGPGSVDLHLGKEFKIFNKYPDIMHITDDTDYNEATNRMVVDDFFVLKPGETILGWTREKITLSPGICGWLEGRSRFARVGLLVHISASFMHPGISNRQCLEISNFSPMPLAVHPGVKICQFIFQRTIGEAVYEGIFKDQGPARRINQEGRANPKTIKS